MSANLELLFNTITDLVFVIDCDGIILHANRSAYARLGLEEDSLVGAPVLTVHPPERRGEVEGVLREMLAGRLDLCRVPLVTRAGSELPVETRVVQGEWDGRPVLFGVSRDVSELRLSEEKFAKAFHASPALMAITDPDSGQFVEVNATFLETLGYDRAEVIGCTALDLALFARPELRAQVVAQARATGSLRAVEIPIRTRDGSVRIGLFAVEEVEISGRPQLLTMMVDITERRGAEEALRESRNQLALIIEATRVGTWDWQIETGEVRVNDRWCAIVGHSRSDLEPISIDTWTALCHPDDLVRSNDLVARHFAGELPYYDCDCRMRHADGHWVWVNDVGLVVERDAAGRPLRMTGTHTDISDRVAAEARRLELEQQLQSMQKTESLRQMAGAVAHHFNNKLAAVVLGLEMHEQDLGTGSPFLPGVREALGAARDAAVISRRLLTYLGESGVRREPVNLLELCDQLVASRTAADSPPVRVLVDAEPPGPVVEVDRGGLTLVIESLLANACEALGASGGEVRLSTGVCAARDLAEERIYPMGWKATTPCVFVAVSDTGIGIAPSAMNRLFDPFYTTKFTGRGLGLAVSLGTVAPYGGAIAVSSLPGRGSTFRVLLPSSPGRSAMLAAPEVVDPRELVRATS